MKHFEDVWVETERVSAELIKDNQEVFEVACELEGASMELAELLEAALDAPSEVERDKIAGLIGSMLFIIARVCKEYDINSWTVMEREINDAKVDLNDQSEG